jgi:hypothetical protein
VADASAALAAEAGIAVFRVGFERWVGAGDSETLADVLDETLDDLRTVTTGPKRRPPGASRTTTRR